jgi:hypothetical protein
MGHAIAAAGLPFETVEKPDAARHSDIAAAGLRHSRAPQNYALVATTPFDFPLDEFRPFVIFQS